MELQPITTNMDLLPDLLPQDQPQIKYDPSKGIANPNPNDVICGRGKMTTAHPGNRRFRQLVRERKDVYQKAKRRDDKTRITFDLVQEIRAGPEGGK
jgi:hypothetical protein